MAGPSAAIERFSPVSAAAPYLPTTEHRLFLHADTKDIVRFNDLTHGTFSGAGRAATTSI